MNYGERLFADFNRLVSAPDGETALIRELAGRVVELARQPRMAAVKARWRDVLALRKPDRPPVWCNPVGCWSELLPETTLVCTAPRCRELEVYFKKLLIKHEIGDDTPMNEDYRINAVFDITPANRWGVDIQREALGADGTAWHYLPALVTEADFDRLVVPRYRVNRFATSALVAEISEILGSVMPVSVSPITGYYSGATLCQPAAELRGMEQLMMDMIDAPRMVHRLMEVMLQGEMAKLDAIVEAGGILPNNDGPMFLSSPLREDRIGDYNLLDCWIHGNSQEFDLISPDMFDEFLLEYQKKIFARFGAACYGCCENLTHKLDRILTIPNLRLLACSGWTDLPTLVERVGDRCCIMWRHKASEVVCPDDLNDFKPKLFAQAEELSGCVYQVVLRELQTLMGHPRRLEEWTRLSTAAVERFS